MKNSVEKMRQDATRNFRTRYAIRKEMETIDGADGLPEATTSGADEARAACGRLVRPFDVDIQVGDVRLLADAKRLTYALVLQDWGEDTWLVMPYSSYAVPAFDGEMSALKSGGSGLNVLQLWNVRPVSGAVLGKSWKVESADAGLLEDAVSAWRGYVGLASLSDAQLARTATSIGKGEDVRREYLAAEKENLRGLFAKDDSAISGDVSKMSSEDWQKMVARRVAERGMLPVWRSPLAREENQFAVAAAELNATEFFRAECDVEETSCIVRLVYDQDRAQLSLRAFDATGEDSTLLDGWKLADATGRELGEVKEGALTTTGLSEFDGVCCLVDPQGGIHALIERAGDC